MSLSVGVVLSSPTAIWLIKEDIAVKKLVLAVSWAVIVTALEVDEASGFDSKIKDSPPSVINSSVPVSESKTLTPRISSSVYPFPLATFLNKAPVPAAVHWFRLVELLLQ